LSWNAVTASPVSGYRIYFGTAARSYQQPPGTGAWAGSGTSFNVSGLQRGMTYYFAVTAVDGQGNESAFSNEASKLVP
jgi:fibronectin type 3 domain-containing protein